MQLIAPLILLVTACSGGQPALRQPSPAQPTTPATTSTLLQPPASATRTADRATLTGLELGTMWTFENPPLAFWQKQYNFAASKEWLDHVRLSSVRYGEICSASFVSPNGLVMTNHHCARECVEANSRAGTDYLVTGFYAASRAEEKICPDLFLDQLVEIEDVTQRVHQASRGATDTEVAQAQAAAIEQMKNACEQQSRQTCEVVSLFHGGQFQLYKFQRYAPVKLVFAPELQAGFFGGDPDNFTYPRYDLDVSFVRAYEANGTTAANTPHYFKWKAEGAREGDLVFVTGNPGSTSRQITVSHVLYEREFRHPFLIQFLRAQRDLLEQMAARGPEAEQQVRENLFEVENSLKATEGQYAGLQDSLLLGQKIRWEREFRERIGKDPNLRAQFGDVWDKIAELQIKKLETSPRLNLSNAQWLGAPHLLYAYELIRYVRAQSQPEAERPEDLRGDGLRQIEGLLQNPGTPDPMISEALLVSHLQMAARWLRATDPLRTRFFMPAETPEAAARRIIQGTRVLDAAFRQQLISGGVAAMEASQDPAIRLALAMLEGRAELESQWNSLTASESVQQERLAKALFAAFGTDLPPDATFTLRISDGVVRGYPYNGTLAPFVTTFYGVFGRAAEFDNEMPFTLPKTYAKQKNAIRMATPLNFVTTNDITGGNSGSPVIDRDARIVGLAFDSNIEALPNEFLYRNETGRAVAVHAAGITEALRNIYRAEALLEELTGAGQ
jgi:hypothetical protein